MSTSRPRFSVTMSDEMYKQINEFWHNNKYPTQTKAIIKILELGLAALDKPDEDIQEKNPPLTISDGGIELYTLLDEIDRAEIRGEMKHMLKSPKYTQDGEKLA